MRPFQIRKPLLAKAAQIVFTAIGFSEERVRPEVWGWVAAVPVARYEIRDDSTSTHSSVFRMTSITRKKWNEKKNSSGRVEMKKQQLIVRRREESGEGFVVRDGGW